MTDRELLELAAKAAGMDLVKWEWTSDPFFEGFMLQDDEPDSAPQLWNPLTDDGDALRLAVKLRLNVILEFSPTYHYAENDEYEALEDMNGCCTRASECNNDPYAATRRAIVRAAAEIGKEVK